MISCRDHLRCDKGDRIDRLSPTTDLQPTRSRARRGQVQFSPLASAFSSRDVDDGRSASPGARPEALAPPFERLSHRVCPPKPLPRSFGRRRLCGHRLHHEALRGRPPVIPASGFSAPARSARGAPYLSRCVSCARSTSPLSVQPRAIQNSVAPLLVG